MFLTDDDTLLKQIAEGDQHAFATFYNRFKDKIYTYAIRLCREPCDAEDIVHNVFLNIWLRRKKEPIQHLDFYVKTATINTCLKFIRAKKLSQKAQDNLIDSFVEEHNELEEKLHFAEQSIALKNAINLLPPQQKLVYQLCKEDGMKYSQVAEHLKISPLTVKTHMQQALRFLRGHLLRNGDILTALTIGYMLHKP